MREPTDIEIETHEPVEFDGRTYHAIWYPQMGGYVGRAWIERRNPGECFEAYVYHDGEFPFGEGVNPVHLHHCSPEQFAQFALNVCRFATNGESVQ